MFSEKGKPRNSAGLILAHDLGLLGPVACGAWQATRPSGPVCRGLCGPCPWRHGARIVHGHHVHDPHGGTADGGLGMAR
jgi:hypothetical protein